MDDLENRRLRRTLAPAATSAAGAGRAAAAPADVTSIVRDTSAGPGRSADEQAVLVTDADLSIEYASSAASQLLGYEPEELLARRGLQLVHVADQPVVTAAVDRALGDPGRDQRFLARVHDKGRRWRWAEGTVTNLLDDPDVRGLVVALRDVTDRVRSREALRLSRALHQARVESAEEGIVVAGGDGAARYANAAAARLLGIPAEQLYGADLDGLLAQRPADGSVPAPRPDGEASPREVGYAHPDGTHRIFEVTRDALGDGDPEGAGWLVTVADVTERRRSERALRHRALYDQLTGLPNRYLLRDRLEMAAARQQRAGGHGTAVLFVDLDRFKAVNDTRGHAAGDQLLRQVATRLAAVVRGSDTVCRLGGDEFVVVCEDIDGSGAGAVVERVQAELRRPYDVAGGPVEVGVSIGVALSPPYPLEELVHLADLAMYRAKRSGGDDAALAGPGDRS